jgi:hypothetical protein
MKQTNKQEVINYLTKTSQHTFSYEDGKLFKIVKEGDLFYLIDENSIQKIKPIDIDNLVVYYGANSKCVIKHSLFLNREVKSIKTNKYTKEIIDNILPKKQVS